MTDRLPPAYRGDEPYVFVSYAHDDADLVQAEIETLLDQGYRVYYDDHIEGGSHWQDELAFAIQSAAVFLIFVTPRSISSANCQRELAFALSEEIPLLAVHLEETELPAGTRLSMGNRQAIFRYLLDEGAYRQRLLQSLGNRVADAPAEATTPQAKPPVQRYGWLLAVLLIACLLTGYLVFSNRLAPEDHAERLTAAREAIAGDQYGLGFSLLKDLIGSGKVHDPELEALWEDIVNPMIPVISEPGANVYFKPYADLGGDWISAGISPIEEPVDAPKGVLRFKVEKAGFETGYFTAANPGPSLVTNDPLVAVKELAGIPQIPFPLTRTGAIAKHLVRVPGTNAPVYLLGWSSSVLGDHRQEIPSFAIARTEVSNAEFKQFVEAGAYENDTYWIGLEFSSNGEALTLDEARALMVDQTGRPGPAGWELSSHRVGEGDLPVGGISWYEAVAYARFRGLTLPTAHHWLRAAHAPYEGLFNTAPAIAGLSQYASDGPRPVAASQALGPWGTVDTAGNMREWVWNFAGDRALVLGGSWTDYASTYQAMHTADPMDRSPQHGLRLMQLLGDTPMPEELLAPVTERVYPKELPQPPISDAEFAALRFTFTAATREPQAVESEEIASTDLWIAEKVSLQFSADETFALVIVRPRETDRPLQSIIYAPPGDAFAMSRSNQSVLGQLRNVEYILKGGRALVIPIWWGSYQRFEPRPLTEEGWQKRLHKAPLSWHRDLVTTLDYLKTRADLDSEKIGLLGISYGSNYLAPLLLALNGRLRTAVIIAGGLPRGMSLPPSMSTANYLPRVTQPVLMINGRYDHAFPYEASQKLYFDLIGTPEAEKRHTVYDVGHFAFPGHALSAEVTDWLDRTLGPVR